MRLPDLVAYDRNPTIQAARGAWRAVAEAYRIRASLPDLQLRLTYFSQPIETRLGPQDWSATISQKFPFPGRLSTEGGVAAREVLIVRLDLDRGGPGRVGGHPGILSRSPLHPAGQIHYR